MKRLSMLIGLVVGLALVASSVLAQDKDAKPATPAPTPQAATKPATKAATPADRLDLETTIVTGNRELPKVLYIVPWKKSELGELPAQPFNTLLDEVLAPVDRDVFKREVKYFHAVNPPAAADKSAASKR
jgi:hypothetical protein